MPATLHMLCGKIASGKSTLAKRLAEQPGTVLISEDTWLGALYADQMSSGADYVRFSAKLRSVMGPHVTDLLRAGVSVVLDYQANTVEIRSWMRGIFETAEASHRLHLMTASDETCLTRLRARNAEGKHPFAVTEAQFHAFTKHFKHPTPDEGFHILEHGGD